MDLLELLQGQMSDGLLENLAKQVGGNAQKEQVQVAAQGALSTLLGGLAKNASSQKGANGLISALDLDHDGSVLDDALGLVLGKKKVANPRTTNGAGILKHILGGKQNNVIDLLSKTSGLDTSAIGKLLPVLAPMVMGALGKARSQGVINTQNVAQVLGRQVQSPKNTSFQMEIAKRFLDKDGDGSILDDLADFGLKALRK